LNQRKAALIFSSLVLFSSLVFGASETFVYNEYYNIQKSVVSGKINLLLFENTKKTFPLPSDRYDRLKHFGTWVNPKSDSSCMDVRSLVLTRESSATVSVSKNCKVLTGQWSDPYSGLDFTASTLIQIDHLVPLKNAYMTGGFEWDEDKRCLYANYMGAKFHLIPVSAHENLSKSDRAPNEFVPSNKLHTCQYLKDWLETKLIWDLRLTPLEVDGIKTLAKSNNCDTESFVIEENEYQSQLTYMNDQHNFCN
jgi:hypothetical protein